MTAVAIQYKDAIIDHIRRGDRLSDAIKALDLGVTPQALSKALKNDPDYNDAFIDYHAARLDKAERMIEDARDSMVDVARAKAFHEAVRWRASKEARERWGDSTSINVTGTVTVDVRNLLEERLAKLDAAIAGQCVRLPDPAEPTHDDE